MREISQLACENKVGILFHEKEKETLACIIIIIIIVWWIFHSLLRVWSFFTLKSTWKSNGFNSALIKWTKASSIDTCGRPKWNSGKSEFNMVWFDCHSMSSERAAEKFSPGRHIYYALVLQALNTGKDEINWIKVRLQIRGRFYVTMAWGGGTGNFKKNMPKVI